MAARPQALDSLIRDIYMSGSRGPLKVVVGPGGLPPWLAPGETAWLDRAGAEGARPGEILALRDGHGGLRLSRLLDREGDRLRLLARARTEDASLQEVVGRVS